MYVVLKFLRACVFCFPSRSWDLRARWGKKDFFFSKNQFLLDPKKKQSLDPRSLAIGRGPDCLYTIVCN